MSYLPGSKICLGTEEDQLLFSRVICVLSNLKQVRLEVCTGVLQLLPQKAAIETGDRLRRS